ncbi:MAG: adenosylmethionine--8-amino-7-oxononanoate transaminase, partial [Deltaproteobacteria bacterium]|nr:adenosylmethionine--8-amino-7-oxononanoate transaminase [Deltaproteobacteria bacterium]
RAQLDRVAHSTLLGLANVPSIELARELVSISPASLTRVFYSDSGSTAVEVAIKMAFQYWRQQGEEGRTRFACLADAYHGDTIGSVSVGGIDLFHAMYRPLLFETVRIPSPYCYRCPIGMDRATCSMECADQAANVIHEHAGELAALVMEPLVQGAAGMIVHPDGFLRRVARACRDSGVLLILDEVATGFGRTGRMFACDHEGVQPDIMALAKGITGGYLPLAATLVADKVFDGFLGEFQSRRTFFHGHTYTGNPLACAAALGNLEVFRRHRVLEHAAGLGRRLESSLSRFLEIEHVGDVRVRGTMAGIELVRDAETKEPFDPALRVGHRVCMEARRHGAILRPLGDVVVLMPPLAMDPDQLDRLARITRESIIAATEAS